MALIKRKVITAPALEPAPAYVSREQAATIICKSPNKLQRVLDLVAPGVHVHYVSDGDWSMHDLVVKLLEQHRPAELYTTTYALREFPMRQLILAKERGDVTTIKMLIDYRAKMRTPEVYQLASMNLTDIRLIAIHAKVAVIRSEQGCVSIVCSSNWTQNPRIEAGTITMDAGAAAFHIDWIEKLYNMQKSLADITPDELEEVTRLAGLFIVPRDIAMMLEINIREFVEASETLDTAVYQAFYIGRLQGEVDLREDIKKMAGAGSVPAQQMMLEFHKQSKIKMIDR